MPVSITEDEAKQLARESKRVKSFLGDKEPVRIIYVPGKLINLVVR